MQFVIFNNQSGDEVIEAMRALPPITPSVVLSTTLEVEIRSLLGISTPHEATLVLLREKHIRRPRLVDKARRSAVRLAQALAYAALATAIAVALGAAAIGH